VSVLQVISLARFIFVFTRSWAANLFNERVRTKAENSRLVREVALLNEQLRIVNIRMMQIPSHRRPFYTPMERMAILEVKAARGWSLAQTAKAFLVSETTVAL